MISWLSRPIRSLRETLEFGDTPRQLAMGVALGMVIGLVPKGNLLCVGLCLAALSTRVNLGAVMMSAVIFSFISPFADPLTHRIGLQLLTFEMLQPAYDMLYKLPLAAWTAFNNTVVLGSFTVGMTMLLPTYWIARRYFEHVAAPAPRRQLVAAPTASRTILASTSPVRIDQREAFQPNIAMAAPADLDELDELADTDKDEAERVARRVEQGHSVPAPTSFTSAVEAANASMNS